MRHHNYERISEEQDGDLNLHEAQAFPENQILHPLDLHANKSSPNIKPPVYYGEGPFDPPSSEDENESLLDKQPGSPGMAEAGDLNPKRREAELLRPTPLRVLVTVVGCLITLAVIIGIIGAFTYAGGVAHPPGFRKFDLDHIFNGTFSVERQEVNWVPEAGDGVFYVKEQGFIVLVDLKSNTTTDLVNTDDIRDEHGNQIYLSDWKISPNMKKILIKADYRKQWRWSSFGNYYIHDIDSKTTHPIIPPTNPGRTAYATWSPTGDAIAYVTDNDLYILPNASPSTSSIRITTAGNASLFNGVPDWVYEEEIFSADFALWWSPDSHKVAFLSFDETAVEEFTFPIYNPTNDANEITPYTKEVVMKYPKPGYNNPIVTAYVFDLENYLNDEADAQDAGIPTDIAAHTLTLDWENRHPADTSIIFGVAWIGNSSLLLKETNRNADDGNVVLFEFDGQRAEGQNKGVVVRKLGKDGEEGDDGWINHEQYVYPLVGNVSAYGTNSYLDIVPNKDGFNHIALFSSGSANIPRFLTSGDWEVTNGIRGVDIQKGIVYFEAATPSTERHLYSIPIPTISSDQVDEPTVLTDSKKPGYYTTSFSPQAGFYLLSYHGPSIPWQKVVKADDPEFNYVLNTNERLQNATMLYQTATVSYNIITNDGFELNVKEYRPPRMDDSGRTKYPVLFWVYGGPGSQMVDVRFGRTFQDYVACGLQYIVVVVDGRGTGFKGRKLRNPVKDNLGYWEVVDQIYAAKVWASKVYVDPTRIGIWGWSYGGFMSCKVVEANAGIHSLSMAVAPVTSWRLYDSIYTERYMNTPQLNAGGYINASITNVTGFHNVDFLLAHGSGDDNVHYANSAHLLDLLTQYQVRNFRFRMFTDSDHGISKRGAQREVYEYLAGFLVEKWGKGGRRRE